jgi:hypothetical protein
LVAGADLAMMRLVFWLSMASIVLVVLGVAALTP